MIGTAPTTEVGDTMRRGDRGTKNLPTRRGRSTRVEQRETALPDDSAEANMTPRPERDRLSEIRLETDTVARGARLGMRFVPLGITSARCGGLAPSLTTFNLLFSYITTRNVVVQL